MQLELNVPVACARNARRGRYAIAFEGFVAQQQTSGYETDSTNNYRSTTATLQIR